MDTSLSRVVLICLLLKSICGSQEAADLTQLSVDDLAQVQVTSASALGSTAQTHGAEFSAHWQPLRRWTLSPNLTEIRGSANAMSGMPQHMFGVQSRLDLTHSIHFNAGVYHHDPLPGSPGAGPGLPPIPGIHTLNRVDLGVWCRPRPQWTLGIWGRNVQSDKHLEVSNDFFGGTAGEAPRSVAFKLMWQSDPESK